MSFWKALSGKCAVINSLHRSSFNSKIFTFVSRSKNDIPLHQSNMIFGDVSSVGAIQEGTRQTNKQSVLQMCIVNVSSNLETENETKNAPIVNWRDNSFLEISETCFHLSIQVSGTCDSLLYHLLPLKPSVSTCEDQLFMPPISYVLMLNYG